MLPKPKIYTPSATKAQRFDGATFGQRTTNLAATYILESQVNAEKSFVVGESKMSALNMISGDPDFGNKVVLTSAWGNRPRKKDDGTSYTQFHYGWDLRARTVPLYSPGNGQIVFKDVVSGGGNALILLFPKSKFFIRFLHLSKYLVDLGDTVEFGQQLGVTGYSGIAPEQAHLHINVGLGSDIAVLNDSKWNDKNNWVDPLTFFTDVVTKKGDVPVHNHKGYTVHSSNSDDLVNY